MNKSLIAALVAGAALALPTLSQAQVKGSVHDFQNRTWNTGKSLCGVCHTVHGQTDQQAPLWAHKSTDAVFKTYASSTMQAEAPSAINGASRACLSCHDGTVAINNYGGNGSMTPRLQGNGEVEMIAPEASLGTDLSNDHPIGIVYDTALTKKDVFLNDPAVTTVPGYNISRTIKDEMLRNDKVECVSCHDIHRQRGTAQSDPRFLVVNGVGSQLCLTCHIK